ncbi:hypothetical protein Clacol_006474 [Clathrus columnatus]|uniref:Uncharacterized protein n=1 Tax=Clathrus columnatus TaxID=1419009 RepID=A0AAV5AGH5_9AGAM|nr:hypothetical protein Clacol_006474 [Clathrus columnatus]
MALNDLSVRPQAGIDVYPGVANPTQSNVQGNPYDSNFVTDPTDPTAGAGAGPNFNGGRDAKRALHAESGVVESNPEIIKSTNIDPLNSEVDVPTADKKTWK